ncbi:MAG TPA: PIN domain-containing protein [Nitrospirales bacterium]|jgi:predicted nucleic acid-binding protein
MESKPWRVFLDTSALIAGILSATGAAREVLRLAEAGVIDLLVSRQVLTEAERTLTSKVPALLTDYHALLGSLSLEILEDPVPDAVAEAMGVIAHHDAPILAVARHANVDYLISWNTRHFQTVSVRAFVTFPVLTPGEFLREFRRRLSS